MEREAFARARRFLDYKSAAKWSAIAASVATGILYVGLLFVLALFADLLVNRGRVPTLEGLSALERERFSRHWNDRLPADQRLERLESIGIDPPSAKALAGAEDFESLSSPDRELVWRASLYRILSDHVGPSAAALTLPDFDELPAHVQKAFHRDRRPGGNSNGAWREHLRDMLEKTNARAAQAFTEDRAGREDTGVEGHPLLADRGILGLVVRSRFYGVDRFLTPVLGTLAAWCPATWEGGEVWAPHFYYYPTVLLVAAALLALLRALAMFASNSLAASAAIEASTRLRRAVYHHTYRLGTLAFRAMGPSEAVGVFTRQIEAVHDGLFAELTIVPREPVKFALLLVVAFVLNLWLSLAFLLFALLVWLIGGQVAAHFRGQERTSGRRAADQLALLNESIMLMRLVKGYSMELFNQSRIERQLSTYAEAQMNRYRGEATYRPLLILLGTLGGIVLLYAAGLIVLSGRLGVARGIVLATVLVSLYWPIVAWLQNRRYFRRARQAAVMLFKFLDRKGEIAQVVGAEFLPPLSQQLEFDNVSMREPGTGRLLLQNISLTIRAGERVALAGPEEMEKYTLIYLIPRLLDPDSGEIRIDRHNLRWVTLESLRVQIGLVLQRNLVFNDTVANNIGCGDSSFDLPKIIEAAKIAHAHQFIQKLSLGYQTPIGELGHSLGVGELYRIALARAILRDPAILIVEEPAAVLDDDTKSLLDDTYSRVLTGRTVIFLPHRVSTIRSCDRIFLLHNGQIEAAGEHRELLTQSELYRHLQYLEFNAFADQIAPQGVLSRFS